MLLKNRLDERIAEVIKKQVSEARAVTNTTSSEWRAQCETAEAAMLGDPDRQVFLSHIAERRGNTVANDLAESAKQMRTSAIFFLARKPS
jgi:hypothetical protein